MKVESSSNAFPELLSTNEAAPLINRKPQTLRKWASEDNGPIRPLRIHGRLAWPVASLRALLQQVQK